MTSPTPEQTPEREDLLVTPGQLSDHMSGFTLSEAQERAAALVLSGLQRGLERRLNRFFGIWDQTETLVVQGTGRIVPSRRPVVEVISLTGLDAAGITVLGSAGWEVGGVPFWIDSDPSLFGRTVELHYRGGEELNAFRVVDLDDVRLAILEKAADLMTDRHDDTVSVKDLETREPTATRRSERSWTEAEVKTLERLKRRVLL